MSNIVNPDVARIFDGYPDRQNRAESPVESLLVRRGRSAERVR